MWSLLHADFVFASPHPVFSFKAAPISLWIKRDRDDGYLQSDLDGGVWWEGGSGAGSPFHLCCHSPSRTRLTQRLRRHVWGSETPCLASLYQE